MFSVRSLLVLVLTASACGGGGAASDGSTTPTGSGGGGPAKPAQAGDVSIDVPAFKIEGRLFEPQALGRPGIPTSPPKKKTTIEKQKAEIAKAKDPVLKQALVVQLASMLYMEGKAKGGDAEKPAMEEARKVLRETVTAVGDKNVEDVSLLFLASFEMYFEDWPAADKAWGALLAKSPKDKDAPYFKTWWSYTLLKQFKNAEALAAVNGEAVDPKSPELAYVIAWSKWRAGDDAGAWTAMVAASTGWTGSRQIIDDELYLLAARSNTPFEQASAQLFKVFNAKQNAQQYEVLVKLGLKAYGFSGRWADGVAALDKALMLAGKTAPVNDVPVIRFSEADFTVRLDNPEAAMKYGKAAIDALPACGAKCTPKEQQDLISAIGGIARVFHFVYATSNDVRYYEPANQLYLAVIPVIMDATVRAERNADAGKLQATMKNMKAGTGTHDKDAIKVLAERHNLEISTCYESVLVSNPKLAGNLSIQLESDATGAIKGATSEPKGGAADLAAVATCVVDQAKTWKLPKRGMAGNTRIKLTYNLSPKK
jgi:tetratricopeptide (TPR) repeat protein